MRRSGETGQSRRLPFRIAGWSALCAAFLVCACSGDASGPIEEPPITHEQCLAKATFQPPETTPYCLPYAEGTTFQVSQSYCSDPGWSHHTRFAYDFLMPIGTEILAARAGEVVEIREQYSDDDTEGMHNNMVSLRHEDGTISLYIHLTTNGVLVEMGDQIERGQLIGLSGSSGDMQGLPHLHLEIFERAPSNYNETVPISFRNAGGTLDANGGLINGETYAAQACP